MARNRRPTSDPIFMDDETATTLHNHETTLTSKEASDDLNTMVNLGKQLEAEREARKVAESRADAAEATKRRLLYESQCHPTVIGGRTGIPPSELDITLTTETIDGQPRQVAWIPVPLFPAPVKRSGKNATWTDPRTGETHVNLDLGTTQIRESLATATCTSISTGATHTVSLTGYASISLHRDSSDEILSRITNREHDADCSTVTDDEDWDKPPFTPSTS